jgi:hypothetical protein
VFSVGLWEVVVVTDVLMAVTAGVVVVGVEPFAELLPHLMSNTSFMTEASRK